MGGCGKENQPRAEENVDLNQRNGGQEVLKIGDQRETNPQLVMGKLKSVRAPHSLSISVHQGLPICGAQMA